jgi:nitrous oxidase accessory protein NosD
MTPIRIVVIALALCACSALAQGPAEGTLTVVVEDQTGARVPGAHIAAFGQATGTHFEATADASGQAVLHVGQGSYKLRVRFTGFEIWNEENVKVNAETQVTATLAIATFFSGPNVIEAPDMPLERLTLAAEIPLVPTQQFAPPDKPLRHKARWF